MDAADLMEIVRAEALDVPVLDDRPRDRADAVVAARGETAWSVYLTDERAGVIESTLRTFDSESDALEHVLLKLRQGERARLAMNSMRADARIGREDGHASG